MNAQSVVDYAVFDLIADALTTHGYCILPQLLPPALTHDLYRRVARLDEHNDLSQAGIGREQQYQLNEKIRTDETRWLDPSNSIDQAYLTHMANFRLAMNQRLFLGLFDYESHYAHYPSGAFYKRHVDAFKGESNRVLTTVMYLNPFWQTRDGGQLQIYDINNDNLIVSVEPEMGTFVVFLSEQFPHEVLPSKRDRYSIAGWFRVQAPLQAPMI
ncbi:proline hydroxylase [Methylophaga nitratireducenticrescens]|uniref:SM-20-like protein n=1 Tax=Methylophaga nitratireducenticrescens TaxID=754476 RepID=I1XHK4_METNJ|nr:2OG-Fe(II) oxygenase [Methylophaga nitratireducenticrescens]AFI83873.1 proline hydroxylase [Methylophaga nitratireducenticrescens]